MLYKKSALLASVCVHGLLVAPAIAQESQAPEETGYVLEEIIVSAQKRGQDIQDVPISMAAIGGDALQQIGFDIGALAGQVPNVEAYGSNTIIPSFYIRGIGLNEFSGNFNGPVAVHRDEVYTSKNWMIGQPLFDMDRVEVLKGPQGTLFGRNTVGGSINYFTRAPSQETNGYFRANADEFGRYNVEGAIGGGLNENLSGRVSFYSGFGTGGPQFNLFDNDDHGRPDVHMLRTQLQWEGDRTTVRVLTYAGIDNSELTGYKTSGVFTPGTLTPCPEAVSGETSRNHNACTRYGGLAIAAGFDPISEQTDPDTFTINQNRENRKNDEFAGGYVRIEHDFDWATLTSLTGYDYYLRDQQDDTDNSPLRTSETDWYSNINVFTQELRLTGSLFEERGFFVLGAFYERDDLIVTESAISGAEPGVGHPFNLVGANLPPRLVSDFEQTIDSFAVFLDYSHDITDRLAFVGGARWTSESTDIVGSTFAALDDVSGRRDLPQTVLAVLDQIDDNTTGAEGANNSRTDEDFSWKLGLRYDVSDEAMVYGTVQTAFRTGGYSVAIGGPIVEFEEENVLSAEVGLKSRWLDDTLQFNAAAFWYEYENHQANVDDPVSPLVPLTRNLPEVETYGIEADITWRPVANLDVTVGGAWLDSEIVDAGGRTAQTISLLGPIPLQGNRLTNMPEVQLNGMVQHRHSISDDLELNTIVDVRWSSERFMELTNQPADRIGSYAVVNARVTLASLGDGWDVGIFVRNLFDREYQTYINNIASIGSRVEVFADPQTFGLSFGYRFN